MSHMMCVSAFSAFRVRAARIVLLAASFVFTAACSDDTSPRAPMPSEVNVRVVNSLYQVNPGGNPVARSIDHLFDSLTTSPSVFNLAPNSISVGSDAPAGYRPLAPGVRSFVARLAGGTPPHPTLYSTQGDGPYLPRVFLNAGRYYTIVVAGTIPASGNIPYGALPFVLLGEDLFPGPVVNGVTQARFKLLHAAPYTTATVNMYVVPGGTPLPRPITDYTSQAGASYRSISGYVNVNPGSYTVTLVSGGVILTQQVIAFSAGDVKTLVLQNTSAVGSGTANHKLTVLNDQHYDD